MSEEEYDGSGNFITRPAKCRQCGKDIGFRDKKPYDVRFVSENVYRITDAPHNQTCPIRIRQRIHQHCVFCRFLDDKDSIFTIRGLFGYETCEKHSDKNADFIYHGKTYKHTLDALQEIYQDAIRRKRRLAKRSEKPRGNEGIEDFL